MNSTRYAALWSDGDGSPLTGSVALDGTVLRLEGSRAGRQARRCVPYDEIAALRLGRSNGERLRGGAALVVELTDGTSIRVATSEPGALHELAEAVTDVTGR